MIVFPGLANFDVNGTLTVTSGSLDISSYTATLVVKLISREL